MELRKNHKKDQFQFVKACK